MNTPNLMDKINELVSKVEYFFAKRWLDKTFGKQEYWGDYIQELITNEEMTTKQKFYSYIYVPMPRNIADCEVSDKKADEFWEWFESEKEEAYKRGREDEAIECQKDMERKEGYTQ